MRSVSRREILLSVAGAAALAGCSENGSTPSDDDVFRETAIDGTELRIELAESVDADAVSVIDPSGESFAEESLSPGATQTRVEIGFEYEPGEYLIVAVAGGETVGETTHTIEPQLEITEVGVGANHPDEMPEELGTTSEAEAFVVVENRGTGPDAIEQLYFDGDVPNPRAIEEGQSGIFDSDTGRGEKDEVLLHIDTAVTLYTSTLPFSFEGDGVNCKQESQIGTAEIHVVCNSAGRVSTEQAIEYSESDSYDGCDIRLGEDV